ncbi:MAG: hypothetical protein KDH88_11215 [Chromatiales bacterium]|nr:hypothetical protein [Chromatiales bacterium]
MNDDKSTSDNEIARLLWVLDDASAPGRKPDLEEIAAWHEGRLNAERAGQVKAHVARDPGCYALWVELRRSEAELRTERVSLRKRRSWLHGLRSWWQRPAAFAWLGGAVTAMLAVILVLPVILDARLTGNIDDRIAGFQLPPTDMQTAWPWGRLIPKGVESIPAEDQDEILALRAGIRRALVALAGADNTTARLVQRLPELAPACADGDRDCQTRRMWLGELGRLLVLGRLSCARSGGIDAGTLGSLRRLIPDVLDRLQDDPKATRFAGLDARQWLSEALAASAFCDALDEKLDTVLR